MYYKHFADETAMEVYNSRIAVRGFNLDGIPMECDNHFCCEAVGYVKQPTPNNLPKTQANSNKEALKRFTV